MTNKFYKASLSFPNFEEGKIYESSLSVSKTADRYPHLLTELKSLIDYEIICAYVGDHETILNDITPCSYVDFLNNGQFVNPITIKNNITNNFYSVGDIIEYYFNNRTNIKYSKIKFFNFETDLLIELENGDKIYVDEIISVNIVVGKFYDSGKALKIDSNVFIYDINKGKLYETKIDKKRYNPNNFIYFSDKVFAVKYCFTNSKQFSLNEILSKNHEDVEFLENKFFELFGDKFNVKDNEFRSLFK